MITARACPSRGARDGPRRAAGGRWEAWKGRERHGPTIERQSLARGHRSSEPKRSRQLGCIVVWQTGGKNENSGYY